jgi:hypothetical protein
MATARRSSRSSVPPAIGGQASAALPIPVRRLKRAALPKVSARCYPQKNAYKRVAFRKVPDPLVLRTPAL